MTAAGLLCSLVFAHVTVIDVEQGRALPDLTVIVEGGRIAAVGTMPAPPCAQVVDGRGKFLIPGLWDMHVHMHATKDMGPEDTSAWTFFAPLFRARGITGVRSMFDSLAAIEKARAHLRIVASGPILDGPHPTWSSSIVCAGAAQGRAAVRRVKREGADFVKVYSGLARETYLAIADEAKKAGLPFAGHVPNSVTAAEASDAGQKSQEHMIGITASEALFAKFIKNGTWVTPTLSVLRATAWWGDAGMMKDERINLLPRTIQQFWRTGWNGWFWEGDTEERKSRFEERLKQVGAMSRAGVKILAGSDTPNPYVFPGDSLHEELGLLVKAGMTPAQALQAATIRPAEYLGMTDRLGSIAPGKLADLVLLSGNPLMDIANTRRIEAVVFNGRFEKK